MTIIPVLFLVPFRYPTNISMSPKCGRPVLASQVSQRMAWRQLAIWNHLVDLNGLNWWIYVDYIGLPSGNLLHSYWKCMIYLRNPMKPPFWLVHPLKKKRIFKEPVGTRSCSLPNPSALRMFCRVGRRMASQPGSSSRTIWCCSSEGKPCCSNTGLSARRRRGIDHGLL